MSTVTPNLGIPGLRKRRSGVLGVALAAWLCVAASGVQGQAAEKSGDSEQSPDYDDVLDRAMDAFDARDYARARGLFEQAWALRPNARVLRGLGISALYLERFTQSKRELTQALEATAQPLTATQRQGVKELLTWMGESLGTLRLELSPPDALVTLDDRPVTERELIVKPGTHRFHVSAEGFTPDDHTVEIAAGQEKHVELSLSREPEALSALPDPLDEIGPSAFVAAEPEPVEGNDHVDLGPAERDSGSVFERWWFWTAVGVVVAGGAATAIVLTSRDSEAKSYEKGGIGGVLMPLGRFP